MKSFAPRMEELEQRVVLTLGTYQQVVGEMPLPSSSAWFSWYDSLLQARIAYSSQPRAHTFHFSQSGDDITGDGSIANPWNSLAKAQSVLGQYGSNVALLFRRGDEWTSTVGLMVPNEFVTIGAYGDTNLPKPLFSAFTIKYNAGTNVWTQVAGTNRWTTSAPSRIGWIRDATNDAARLSPFTYLLSASSVAANARSWYWDGSTLHFNPGVGVNPNLVNYEATGHVTSDGIRVSGDGSLVTDIRADGWGAVATLGVQAFGIKLSNYAGASVVVMNSEAYYNGRHGISVHGYSTTSGGLHLIYNCVTGYTTDTGSGVTQFNNFMPYGANEALFDGLTVRFGKLPDWNLVGGGADKSPAVYGHAAANLSLFIVKDVRVTAEDLPGATYSTGQAYYDPTRLPGNDDDLSSLRMVYVNYQIDHELQKRLNFTRKSVYVNSSFDIELDGGTEQIGSISGGWFINNVFQFDDLSAMRRIFHVATTANPGSRYLNNTFYVNGTATVQNYHEWILVYGNFDQNSYAANNLFVRTNNRPFKIGVPNDPYHLVANAYVGVTKTGADGYALDPYGIEPVVYPLPGVAPSLESSLVGRAIQNPFGITVEFDFFGNPRNLEAPTIGAIEFEWAALPTTASGSYYIVNAGQSLSLEVTDALIPGANYMWDINGDGNYSDAAGHSATLTWNQVSALGLTDGHYQVRVRIADGSTTTTSDPAVLVVRDRLPVVHAGEDQFLFEGLPLYLDASKTYAFNPAEVLVFSWDINGDGVFGDAWGETATVSQAQLQTIGLVAGTTYSTKVRVWRNFDPSDYVESGPIMIFYGAPPVADAGGPYSGAEGTPITISTTDYGTFPQYAWDLDNDGEYDDAFGTVVTFTAPDQGEYTVGFRLTIGSYVSTDTATVQVVNQPPQVSVGPGNGRRGETLPIVISITDSAVDMSATFTIEIDWDFNGSWDETIVDATTYTVVNRTFDKAGLNLFRVRATDKDGAVSVGTVSYRNILGYEVISGVLFWYGSNGDDAVSFETVDGTSTRLTETKLNGVTVQNVFTVGAVNVHANGRHGDDVLDASLVTATPVTLYGGMGSDTIRGGTKGDFLYGDVDTDGGEGDADYIDGGAGNDLIYGDGPEGSSDGRDTILGGDGSDIIFADGAEGAQDSIDGGSGDDYIDTGGGSDFADGGIGNDILLGGSGRKGAKDTLLGGDGRDILIGDVGVYQPPSESPGLDSLDGGAGDDIIVAGIFRLLTEVDVFYIQSVWSSNHSYSQRVAYVLGTESGGPNGTTHLVPGENVLDDNLVDIVLGGDGQDLIIGNDNVVILE